MECIICENLRHLRETITPKQVQVEQSTYQYQALNGFDNLIGYYPLQRKLDRMKATDPDARMPELGRTAVDHEGVELVEEWITSLEGH